MKEFDCGAVVPGCTRTFRGDDEEDILAQVAERARRDHGMASVPPEVADEVRTRARDAA